MTQRASVFAALGAATLLNAATIDARDVNSADPPFRAAIPDEFAPVGGTRDAVYVFATHGAGTVPRVITLRPLSGPLAQAELDESALREMVHAVSPGAAIRVVPGRALGVDVPIVLGESAEQDSLALAQVPTLPRALQIVVTGPAHDGAAVERITRGVMASLDARTDWLSHGEILRRKLARALIVLGWAALASYGAAWLAMFRRSPRPGAQRIALFAVGVVFLATAALLASVRRGASAFEPVTPAIIALVLLVNAFQLRAVRPATRG